MATIEEAFNQAVQCHQAGDWGRAEHLYRHVCLANPRHADAHHMLGILAYQQSRFEAAVASLRDAVAANSSDADYHNNLGLALQATGCLEEAVASFNRALILRPDLTEAHSNLGNALLLQKRHESAAIHYRQAIQLRPGYVPAHCGLGLALVGQGQLEQAENQYRQAIDLDPNCAEGHNNLADVLLAKGRLDDAIAHCRRALQLQPNLAEAYANLGNAHLLLEEWNQAEAHFFEALRIKPNYAEAFNGLGRVALSQGRLEQAIEAFQQALRLQPEFCQALVNFGDALLLSGRIDAASEAYRDALQLRPDDPAIYLKLALPLQARGDYSGARAALDAALRLRPTFAEAHNALGYLLTEQGQCDEALVHYERAVACEPDFPVAHTNMASVLAELGRHSAAHANYELAIRLLPSDSLKVRAATALPAIYQSVDDLVTCRERLCQNVRRLRDQGVTVDLTHQLANRVFFLPYQGFNDRDLQRELAALHTGPKEFAARPPRARSRPSGKIHFGMISNCFRNHSVGQWLRGLVAQLSREWFTVTVLSIGSYDDVIARLFKKHADRYLEVPPHLPTARRLVADLNFDVILYPDIGLDGFTNSLAHSRLAPVQCTTVGHPTTSGLDTIDYFISGEDLETAEADGHYSETLVRLKALPIYFYRPQGRPGATRREDLGFTQEDHLYGCLQYLFKFHPEFDSILGGILRADPKGIILLSQGKIPAWEGLLRERFARTLPDVLDRIRVLPLLDYPEYLDLLAATDVQLDPLHFGGGMTSYEALAIGLPIVTWPSPLLRSRFSYALYKQMQIKDGVASSSQDYIERAVRLGTDTDYRESLRSRILAANEILFENGAGIREWERFLLGVCA